MSYSENPRINDAVLTIINDGNGAQCGMDYAQRCAAAETGVSRYRTACARYSDYSHRTYGSPRMTQSEIVRAADILQAYYRENLVEQIEDRVHKYPAQSPRLVKTLATEALADIAYMAAARRYHSGDSRDDIDTFIQWANEFEGLRVSDGKGNELYDGEPYMDAIQTFMEFKLAESGYCNDTCEIEDDTDKRPTTQEIEQ
jgi:hypothetical protein